MCILEYRNVYLNWKSLKGMYLIFGLYFKRICKFIQIHMLQNYLQKAKHCLKKSDSLKSQDNVFDKCGRVNSGQASLKTIT